MLKTFFTLGSMGGNNFLVGCVSCSRDNLNFNVMLLKNNRERRFAAASSAHTIDLQPLNMYTYSKKNTY
ncbi:hypothetical protein KSC_099370 [Ktedonobacter sp. SOSP1-52]|nr:hypothetical protein KSC_099370 [Ktedonobacter sp. SOSP1-52]